MKQLVYHPNALRELEDAASYYETQQPGVGERFLAKIIELEGRLRNSQQQLGMRFEFGTRLLKLDHFPYGLVFHVNSLEIFVLAVIHLRRRPGYWHSRLADSN